jgi:hypothetical protein
MGQLQVRIDTFVAAIGIQKELAASWQQLETRRGRTLAECGIRAAIGDTKGGTAAECGMVAAIRVTKGGIAAEQ